MAAVVKELTAVSAQAGRPLYQAVRDAVRAAIDAGMFAPGEQIPSTKDLSEQLAVSLVTAHRALQELVSAGVLHRAQGKGTFVHPQYHEQKLAKVETRVGVVLHHEASVGDFYHGQIFEGVRRAAHEHAIDLMLLRYGDDGRHRGCTGYLFVNPLPRELETFMGSAGQRHPVVVVGAQSEVKRVASIDVDNIDLARHAVKHLRGLDHARIAYVGGDETVSNSRDRWLGFRDACRDYDVKVTAGHVVRSPGWRLENGERAALIALLRSPTRPTAIFAGGYDFALDVYAAATAAGLTIPEDLSVVGVDDPASATHLSPALTTLRQPLVEMGHASLTALFEAIAKASGKIESRQLRSELVVRKSSARLAPLS
ncbi:MAG: GntR family transcriptional regulator [Planctomycetota bacterium]|nr:GntR family transcriptional regulator [Planctomycetota bacterium]